MRSKSKPLIAGRVSVAGRRLGIRPLDDGIMTVPIPTDQRTSADAEMKDFIKHHKQKEQFSHK